VSSIDHCAYSFLAGILEQSKHHCKINIEKLAMISPFLNC